MAPAKASNRAVGANFESGGKERMSGGLEGVRNVVVDPGSKVDV
jgi:hypothetical protein